MVEQPSHRGSLDYLAVRLQDSCHLGAKPPSICSSDSTMPKSTVSGDCTWRHLPCTLSLSGRTSSITIESSTRSWKMWPSWTQLTRQNRHHDLCNNDLENERDGVDAGIRQRCDVRLSLSVRDTPVSYTHLRAHETRHDLVCRLLLE